MIIKVCVTDIYRDELNFKCLESIKKFAEELRIHNGLILNINDNDIVSQVFHHTKSSSCSTLEARYNELKAELKRHISKKGVHHSKALKRYAHQAASSCDEIKPLQNHYWVQESCA